MPTCNPKLKYSHAITHDATTLKRPRPTACRSRAAEIFNFRLIRSDSIARNFIFLSPLFFQGTPQCEDLRLPNYLNNRRCFYLHVFFLSFVLVWFVLFVFVTFVLYIGFRTEKRGVPVRNLCQSKGGNNVAGQSGSSLAAPVQVYRMAKEEDFCCCFSLFLRLFLSFERTVTYSPWQS